jgi:hypothetical protein
LIVISALDLWQVGAVVTLTVETTAFGATDGSCAHFCIAESTVIGDCSILDFWEYG